jgi:hypothetical protein
MMQAWADHLDGLKAQNPFSNDPAHQVQHGIIGRNDRILNLRRLHPEKARPIFCKCLRCLKFPDKSLKQQKKRLRSVATDYDRIRPTFR